MFTVFEFENVLSIWNHTFDLYQETNHPAWSGLHVAEWALPPHHSTHPHKEESNHSTANIMMRHIKCKHFFPFKVFSKFGQTQYLIWKPCLTAVMPAALSDHSQQRQSRKRPFPLSTQRLELKQRQLEQKETHKHILKHTHTNCGDFHIWKQLNFIPSRF